MKPTKSSSYVSSSYVTTVDYGDHTYVVKFVYHAGYKGDYINPPEQDEIELVSVTLHDKVVDDQTFEEMSADDNVHEQLRHHMQYVYEDYNDYQRELRRTERDV